VFVGVPKTAYIRQMIEACVHGCSLAIAPVTVKSLSEVAWQTPEPEAQALRDVMPQCV
jgi:hypothetical protein